MWHRPHSDCRSGRPHRRWQLPGIHDVDSRPCVLGYAPQPGLAVRELRSMTRRVLFPYHVVRHGLRALVGALTVGHKCRLVTRQIACGRRRTDRHGGVLASTPLIRLSNIVVFSRDEPPTAIVHVGNAAVRIGQGGGQRHIYFGLQRRRGIRFPRPQCSLTVTVTFNEVVFCLLADALTRHVARR